MSTLRMTAAFSTLTAVLAIWTAPAVLANNPNTDSQVCLDARDIDHTKILNDHQILFYMAGRKVWINNLPYKCGALRDHEGFVRVSSNPEYCDNLETIKVRPTGQTCLLGGFTPYGNPKP